MGPACPTPLNARQPWHQCSLPRVQNLPGHAGALVESVSYAVSS